MGRLLREIRSEGIKGMEIRHSDMFPDKQKKEEFVQKVIEDFTNPTYHLRCLVYIHILSPRLLISSSCTIAQKPKTVTIDANGNVWEVMKKRID